MSGIRTSKFTGQHLPQRLYLWRMSTRATDVRESWARYLNPDGIRDLLIDSLLVLRLGEGTGLEVPTKFAHGSGLLCSTRNAATSNTLLLQTPGRSKLRRLERATRFSRKGARDTVEVASTR